MNKDDFYIGYLPNMPDSYKSPIRWAIIALVVLLPLIAVLIVMNQKNFSRGHFEFGKITTLRGLVSNEPIPTIKIIHGKDIHGNTSYQTIPLIGYGKFGASGFVEDFKKRINHPLEDVTVNLHGTLLYRDGKTLFELTEQEGAFKEYFFADNYIPKSIRKPKVKKLGNQTIIGEIIDPKCFFGVMKPGHGKTHRSCAIRCISGGIPPMLWAKNKQGESNYYILLDKDNKSPNKAVLPYVGETVEIDGKVSRSDDWFLLNFDAPENIKRLQ